MSTINIKLDSPKSKRGMKKMAVNSNYEVRWQNFKGFVDTGWIEIKPITIIIGANNSGKTSFISPILLMNQTITAIDGISPLVISGKVYDGGNIKELIHNYDLKKEFTFGFKYFISKDKKKIHPLGTHAPGAVEITFGVNNDKDREIFVKSHYVFDTHFREYLKIIRDKFSKYRIYGKTVTKLTPLERKSIRNVEPLNFLFSPNSFLYQFPNNSNAKKTKFSDSFSELLRIISSNFSMFRNTLAQVSFIGPIRENPKRYYEFKNENFYTVGSRGENVPDLIKKNERKIQKDLNHWINKFQFGDTIELQRLSNSVCSILFRRNGEKTYTNIANAGFGASQILPLIVQALVSKEESLTIAEQPEIHLNPKLQGVLAELFCLMAKKDQRIIVETHSEHLLMRLRTLVAKKQIPLDNIAIYFVEKKDGESNIRPIKMEEDGSIPSDEWPDGFFEDTLKESFDLIFAQAKNKQTK